MGPQRQAERAGAGVIRMPVKESTKRAVGACPVVLYADRDPPLILSVHSATTPLPRGEVPEWSIGAVSKTVERASVPRVRIPLSPPLFPKSQIPPRGTILAFGGQAKTFLSPVPIPPTGGGAMSGRRVQHFVVRGKSFQVRLYVPVDLQRALERKELRWSVRIRESKVA